MVLTAYNALSPVTGLFCHCRLRKSGASAQRADTASRKLDASVGASGPHDFAVRVGVARPRSCELHAALDILASTASRTHVRDDRDTPLLMRRDGAEDAGDL